MEHLEAAPRIKANRYNHLVALFLCLGSFTYGFSAGIIGGVIGQPSWYSYFNMDPAGSYASSMIETSIGVYYAGGFIGCLVVNWLADTFGRRATIRFIAAWIIASCIIQTASVHIAMFIVGRMLGGVGAGMVNTMVPMYISELAPAAQRGRLVGFHGALTIVAYGMVGWASLGVYFEPNPQIQWRLLLALQLVTPLVLLAGSWKLPESPRWLVSRDRNEEGLAVLEKLHFDAVNPQHDGARDEYEQIRAFLEMEKRDNGHGILNLIQNKQYRRRMWTGFFLQVVGQTTGVLVINNYMVVVLRTLGVVGWKPLMVNGFYNSWAASLNFLNAMIVDRVGRIKIIAIGITGGILSLCVVTGLIANYGSADNTNQGGAIAAIAFMFVFVTCYGSCVDASSYIYCSEIFPTHIRAQGVGFSTSAVFLLNTVYNVAAGTAFHNIGWKFYLIFILVPTFCLPIIVLYLPETKGLSLEEVGQLFGDKTNSSVSNEPGSVVHSEKNPVASDHVETPTQREM